MKLNKCRKCNKEPTYIHGILQYFSSSPQHYIICYCLVPCRVCHGKTKKEAFDNWNNDNSVYFLDGDWTEYGIPSGARAIIKDDEIIGYCFYEPPKDFPKGRLSTNGWRDVEIINRINEGGDMNKSKIKSLLKSKITDTNSCYFNDDINYLTDEIIKKHRDILEGVKDDLVYAVCHTAEYCECKICKVVKRIQTEIDKLNG